VAQVAVCSQINTTDKVMMEREIIADCYEIRTKYINALWAEHRISEC